MDKTAKELAELVRSLRVLIVDDELYSRKVVRALLAACGVRQIMEASDGAGGLDAILTSVPDLVLVDWEMPGLDGPGFLRRVRAPGAFPLCDVPIIMITAHGERSHVTEAIRLGVHEYLLKPVSMQALMSRIVSIFRSPRPMVQKGGYYGPLPRKGAIYKPDREAHGSDLVILS